MRKSELLSLSLCSVQEPHLKLQEQKAALFSYCLNVSFEHITFAPPVINFSFKILLLLPLFLLNLADNFVSQKVENGN